MIWRRRAGKRPGARGLVDEPAFAEDRVAALRRDAFEEVDFIEHQQVPLQPKPAQVLQG